MEDVKNELIIKMIVKINEAKTYNRVRFCLVFLWFLEFFAIYFDYLQYNLYYWLVLLLFLLGTYHMGKKFEKAMEEYEDLKNEYEKMFGE